MSESSTENSTPLEERLDSIFTARRLQDTAPASVFLVDLPGRQRIAAGFGDVDGRGNTPTSETAFRIASCTKSFTAALVLVLRDEGLIDLDRPAKDYVPELGAWKLPSASSAHPTIRMFLTMSSGLATDNEWADRQESMSAADFNALLEGGVCFLGEPGTAFEYSNLGYAVLGRLVEKVTGHGYAALVRTRLLEPLGLDSTGFSVAETAQNLAVGYARRNGQWEPLQQPGPGAFSAIGGIYSTAHDLATWGGWLCSAFDVRDSEYEAVLSSSSRREMQQIHRHIPGRLPVTGYGYGLFVGHDENLGQVVSHSGGYPGFSSHMRWQTQSGLLAIGLENATYAAVHTPVTTAFDVAATRLSTTAAEPWPQTLAARGAVESLLREWDETIVTQWFADNVALDLGWDTRRTKIDAYLHLVGTLNFASGHIEEATPARLRWQLPGTRGTLRCSILMHPLAEPLIQRFDLELVQDRPTADE